MRGNQASVRVRVSRSPLRIQSKQNSSAVGPGFRIVAGPAPRSAVPLPRVAGPEQKSLAAVDRAARRLLVRDSGSRADFARYFCIGQAASCDRATTEARFGDEEGKRPSGASSFLLSHRRLSGRQPWRLLDTAVLGSRGLSAASALRQ